MQRFWLGTWEVKPPTQPTGRQSDPIAVTGASRLAIEVLQEDQEYVVLISTADSLDDPRKLQCRIGFANGAKACSRWRSRGFPLVDATIRHRDGLLEVFTAFFSDPEPMQYADLLLEIEGVHFDQSADAGPTLAASYEQFQEAPERGKSATFILRKKVRWDMARTDVTQIDAKPLTITAPSTRSPSLIPVADGSLAITHAWSGLCAGPTDPVFATEDPEQVNRRDLFGAAAFWFRDIEALYFSIDLEQRAGAEAFLDELISPLNFSLDQAGDFDPGFRYRVARQEIVIQLLRYGRMQLADDPPPPLDETDYQSQHELVVLVNVAKVDDGETQMHDGAVYVPAVFVDNPWSKILGRDLQGFEKCLADFCVLKDGQALRLRPDGRLGAGDAASRPLADVGQINLVGVVSNEATSPSPPMLEISYPDGTGSWHAFRRLDPHDLNPLLAQPAWRLQDSDIQKAGLGFTRLELQDRLDQFHSIQSTPVDDRQLQKAWISATCDISDRSDEAPSETVELIFHALEAAPRGWRILCEMLGAKPGGSVPWSIGANHWFRSRFSMHLTGHDE